MKGDPTDVAVCLSICTAHLHSSTVPVQDDSGTPVPSRFCSACRCFHPVASFQGASRACAASCAASFTAPPARRVPRNRANSRLLQGLGPPVSHQRASARGLVAGEGAPSWALLQPSMFDGLDLGSFSALPDGRRETAYEACPGETKTFIYATTAPPFQQSASAGRCCFRLA